MSKTPKISYHELQSVELFFNLNGYGERLNKILENAELNRNMSESDAIVLRWNHLIWRLRLAQKSMIELLEFSNKQAEIYKNNFKQKQNTLESEPVEESK